jgi:hypothetical protein
LAKLPKMLIVVGSHVPVAAVFVNEPAGIVMPSMDKQHNKRAGHRIFPSGLNARSGGV